MPGSMPQNMSRIVQIVRRLDPSSVLDVGCGFGKYGVIFREYLDVLKGRYYMHEWKTRIDAVEVYEPYITELHEYVYDNIYISDVRDYEQEMFWYDLVFYGDVIEHFTKEEGLKILDNIRRAKYALISTPDHMTSGPNTYMDNEHEAHKYIWKPEDFAELEHWKLNSSAKDRYMQTILLEEKKCSFVTPNQD